MGDEIACEDELPARRKDTRATPVVSFVSCLNTHVSCHIIDVGVPTARYEPTENRRARAYLSQIEIVARAKQLHVSDLGFNVSMGQMAAILLHRTIAPDIYSTYAIVGMMCFEATTEKTSLCIKSPIFHRRDVDLVNREMVTALGVSPVIRARYGRDATLTPTLDAIKRWYPRGCSICIFNLSALLVKCTLCYDIVTTQRPCSVSDRMAGPALCDVLCCYAFSTDNFDGKHRLMHLFQTAMLLETHFISTYLRYDAEMDAALQLRIHKKKMRVLGEHTNTQDCLHAAICAYMNYDSSLVVPWVCVAIFIAVRMFATIGSDHIADFVRPKKRCTGHCILSEKDTKRVLYCS